MTQRAAKLADRKIEKREGLSALPLLWGILVHLMLLKSVMEINRDTCFVIQPFDNGKFDSRFEDVFKPAIEKAGLEAYRVDRNPGVRVPIDEIERKILRASICLADITIDNPNVWYELGFAYACNKDVVMVCSKDERQGSYPFDIRHKTIISYSLSSKSGFTILEEAVTEKLKALLETAKNIHPIKTPVNAASINEQLTDSEVMLLKFILEEQPTHEEKARLYQVNKAFIDLGYDGFSFGLSMRSLVKKGLVVTSKEYDEWNNGEYTACQITEKGEEWILHNFEKDHRLNSSLLFKNNEVSDLPF
ncbi:hypothetical protein DXT99_21630 [Pontibacter diazotrophicus]|uniref:Uncharacterized protein n=1 Tax=Pontibacter diazotrophicus TaxID=1400979 RepID=A0A3D8L6U2_9BACT|nr:hypothetical protein [Pontibacter diazotrophicus]RDV13097.1 hypothetical protein DXT99_21630 [Pontibacter diazotrophicus]